MSSSDSHSLTYESILESFVSTLLPPKKAFKCYYNECDKCFTTQSRLNEHKRRRHAVQDITLREPIESSTDARDQSTTATDDGQQQPNAIPVANTSNTSSPDSQSLDNIDTNGTELVDTIPTVNTGQTLPPIRSDQQLATTSLVDSNPCLNSINTNTGHTSATANPLQTSGQTVVDLPTTHVCRIGGCGLEFYIEYTLIAHQRAVHKTTAQDIHFGYQKSGVSSDTPIETTTVLPVQTITATTHPNNSDMDSDLEAIPAGPTPTVQSVYTCKKCDKTFDTKPDLKTHRRTVHSKTTTATALAHKPHACLSHGCGQSFATIAELKRHRLAVHSAKGRQYRCDGCDKKYYTRHMLDKHRLKHSVSAQVTLRPTIECEVNSNNSDSDSDLEVIDVLPAPKHTAHTVPVRPITGRTSKRLLIDITNTSKYFGYETSGHTNSYLCDVEGCGGVFVWKYELDLHHAIAHKVAVRRAHPCGQCEQSFDSVDQWADHKLDRHRVPVHSHPTYACDQCDHKPFKRRRRLIGHQYAVHSQPMPNPFTCSQCDRQFVTHKKRIRHQMSVHSLSATISPYFAV
ncbi:unnamed protein product [Medioppia subpectinata]|uniref:C2H2-type domain-containing protein n=1 Tax=Medioppia subpectinata TaxID=1979941 RepID=A0A7R9Q2X3_9ACAR|nr:unnamed protein product [Medioppia subpectinata]CAG2110661.1 unnamed protein product [Medioppia subpectinata]